MNGIIKSFFACAIFASATAAQFSAAGDTVYTTPAKPTAKDSITYNFYDSDACCCAQFVNPAVFVSDTMVFLSFSVNTAPCQSCRCLLAGARYAFKGGTLKAGRYGIYREQSFYCPPGTPCPLIALLPVRIGQVVVQMPTASRPVSPQASSVDKFDVHQDRGVITFTSAPGLHEAVTVKIFNARGMCMDKRVEGRSFSWPAPSVGVYFVSVDVNGVAPMSHTVIVAR